MSIYFTCGTKNCKKMSFLSIWCSDHEDDFKSLDPEHPMFEFWVATDFDCEAYARGLRVLKTVPCSRCAKKPFSSCELCKVPLQEEESEFLDSTLKPFLFMLAGVEDPNDLETVALEGNPGFLRYVLEDEFVFWVFADALKKKHAHPTWSGSGLRDFMRLNFSRLRGGEPDPLARLLWIPIMAHLQGKGVSRTSKIYSQNLQTAEAFGIPVERLMAESSTQKKTDQ